jgi:predicted acyl esterase
LLWPALFLAISMPAEELQPPFVFEPDIKIAMRDGVQLAANVFRALLLGALPLPRLS